MQSKQKNIHPQVENLKRRLGQKSVSRWTENPKGRFRKKLRIKSARLCPVGSLQPALLPRSKVQMVQDQFNQLLSMARDDVRRHRGNSRVGT